MVLHYDVDMTILLEQALQELRQWSADGRRAELLAAAWRLGETNVNTLAETARVSRPTVYSDLATVGIDPRSDRGEESPEPWRASRRSQADGLGTAEKVREAVTTYLRTVVSAREAGDRNESVRDDLLAAILLKAPERFDEYVEAFVHDWQSAQYHNGVVLTAQDEYDCGVEAVRAIQRSENKWEALRDAERWMAAHHQWVEAVDDARVAIARWVAAAKARAELDGKPELQELRAGYDRNVEGRDRLPDGALDRAQVASTELEETYRKRLSLSGITLSAQQQP